MERIGISITPGMAGRTAGSVLEREGRASGSLVSRLKLRSDGILVNGERAYTTRVLISGDYLSFLTDEDEKADKAPAPLTILYEDSALLVVNKPAGLAVQPVQDETEITLETHLKAHLGLSSRPHPVSRLDRGTSGLMPVAKNGYVHELMKRQLGTDGYYKEYRALVKKRPDPKKGEINAPIGFTEGSTYARCVRPDGAPSVSLYETLTEQNGLFLMKLVPVTGRTHQLRVHMAYIGCPLYGDWLYGEREKVFEHPALHACYLRLRHPVTGETMEFYAPPEWEHIPNQKY